MTVRLTLSDTEPTPEPSAPEMTSSEARKPGVFRIIPRVWAIVTGVVVVLSVGAAAIFGGLWFSTKSDLVDVEHELVETQARLTDTKDELAAQQVHMTEYERDAKYTACIQFFGGWAYSQEASASVAHDYAKEKCAAESAWTFSIVPAP